MTVSPTQTVFAGASAVLVLGVVIFYVLPYLIDRPIQGDSSVTTAEILTRVARDRCHRAPEEPYSLADAHRVFRERINCDTDSCGAKYAAYWTLVDHGRIVPSRELAR
ncbi:hypothetical protein [Nocardia amamiensis]|uniref:hypothetical protein n=1 Tax=Nocardia amamiensis TaxID=404578 RepID=UPI0008331262|nr:hypothetical protein [Nocardia amamiensis]